MFYSRPNIEPLGWDLLDLPTPSGSKNFDGLTSDNRPVDFRFSGGWLSAARGQVGASADADLEEVLSARISPFGTMDITAEQVCDILGITVRGEKVDAPARAMGARGFDWSGRTTYWQSTHRMYPQWDAEPFIHKLCQAFPGSVLIQPSWYAGPYKLRCRQIRFLMDTDAYVVLGIGYDQTRLRGMLESDEVPIPEFESLFEFSIEFSRADSPFTDISGNSYVKQRGADQPDLDYWVINHRQYRIRTEFKTADSRSHAIMRELLSIIDGYFIRGLEVVDLQSGAILREDLSDEDDTHSYSKAMRDWCFAMPKRYLYVGFEDPAAGTGAQFVGMRPIR
jgi:hypothetical protein